MTELFYGKVDCRVKNEIPPENETIADDINIDMIVKFMKKVIVSFRDKESCPFNRGNWIIDFHIDDSPIPFICLKLPSEMTKEQIDRWIKPLSDRMNNKHD